MLMECAMAAMAMMMMMTMMMMNEDVDSDGDDDGEDDGDGDDAESGASVRCLLFMTSYYYDGAARKEEKGRKSCDRAATAELSSNQCNRSIICVAFTASDWPLSHASLHPAPCVPLHEHDNSCCWRRN